jgi:hypothetical protein
VNTLFVREFPDGDGRFKPAGVRDAPAAAMPGGQLRWIGPVRPLRAR